jgi:hypothetical protein
MLSDTFSRQGLTPNKLKSTVVLHIGQPVKIVVAEPDRVIVAEQKTDLSNLVNVTENPFYVIIGVSSKAFQ